VSSSNAHELESLTQLFDFYANGRNLKSTMKSILRGLTRKGNSQNGSLAKFYLVEQDKDRRNFKKRKRSSPTHNHTWVGLKSKEPQWPSLSHMYLFPLRWGDSSSNSS
jgi:hypothetical protein